MITPELSLAQFLLDSQPEFNGHKQTEVPSMSFQNIRKLIIDLEHITGESFTLELWVNGTVDRTGDTGSIYRHRIGMENQLILGITEIT
jgi:hypothetical protein